MITPEVKAHILLADDDTAMNSLHEIWLGRLGFRVTTAETINQAVVIISTETGLDIGIIDGGLGKNKDFSLTGSEDLIRELLLRGILCGIMSGHIRPEIKALANTYNIPIISKEYLTSEEELSKFISDIISSSPKPMEE